MSRNSWTRLIQLKEFKRVLLMLILLSSIVGLLALVDSSIPDQMTVFTADDLQTSKIITLTEITSKNHIVRPVINLEKDKEETSYSKQYSAKLFNIIPLKKVTVTFFNERMLIPGGMVFGVKLITDGILVTGLSDIDTAYGSISPAKMAGLTLSDAILSINGITTNSVEEVTKLVNLSQGKTVLLEVLRGDDQIEIEVDPVYSSKDDQYKIGVYLRDSTMGIGTVTFIDPKSRTFSGLGHGIYDLDTGVLLSIKSSIIADATVDDVVKGVPEFPGELKGKFKESIGIAMSNTHSGIFGVLDKGFNIDKRNLLPIGLRQDVKEGRASIISMVNSKGAQEYEIEIIKIYKNSDIAKNFLLKITDSRLLEETGGIVQGMSGSPIIQDGKIIGALTHVLVGDPSKGYGVFLDNILSAIPEELK